MELADESSHYKHNGQKPYMEESSLLMICVHSKPSTTHSSHSPTPLLSLSLSLPLSLSLSAINMTSLFELNLVELDITES